MLNFIFTATSFNDAVKRATYLKSYRKYRHEQVDNINRTQKEMSDRINLLTQNKQEKSKVIEEQHQQKELLESEKNEKNQFVTKLKAREKEIEKEVAAKRKVERSLQNSIAAIIKREIEAAKRKAEDDARKVAASNVAAPAAKPAASSSTASVAPIRKTNVLENTPEVTKVSVGFENNRGNLPWPVDKATITSSFGRQRIEGTKIEEDNGGITIQTVSGSAVKAVFEGVVTTVYDVAGSQTVTIKHGKYFTTYFNMSSVNVSKGSKVSMGEVIGRAGENFDGEGEIVFMVNEELRFVNPELWLKRK
jgi:septal ring factor EnvC (AmiA/AmiB activator)